MCHSVWPDLTKNCDFGNFRVVNLVFENVLIMLWRNCYALGHIFIVLNDQIFSSHLVTLVSLLYPSDKLIVL